MNLNSESDQNLYADSDATAHMINKGGLRHSVAAMGSTGLKVRSKSVGLKAMVGRRLELGSLFVLGAIKC
ncbi:hypothetical protein L484_015538 [Morus notabilis]|uniref:Uncharacterized protein n=1 Tax=Morus notabilis TaxID=981085 RepID=W9RIW3_9ROSA|nr:hypothetical protein L484_015538 [Morus notabilis]